ncbi:hypothetical protein GF380_06455 [Candidatus Uhrbacteria bacterium]|nr:hypothetical protein [Candidatus Uhrbacteria bacterium]
MIKKIPCPEHGHPGEMRPQLAAWVEFYNVVAPYSDQARLDHVLISKLCLDAGLTFSEAFEKLSTIHKAVYDARKHKGISEGDSGHGNEGTAV